MKNEPKKYVTTKDAELLERLMDSVKERYSMKDIVFYFTDNLHWQEQDQLFDAIMALKDLKEDIICRVKDELKVEGYTILKPETLDKKSKLDEFISSVLCPFYNEYEKTMFV